MRVYPFKYISWFIIGLSIGLIGLGVASATAQQPALPQTMPDTEAGLAIFAERCANCHGEQARGDGAMAVNAGISPTAFADPQYRKIASPAVLFDTITNGRIENSMPPFGPSIDNAVSEENRWNLVAAIFSYSTPPGSIATGKTVYEAHCANCHGETGQGDGPEAAPETTDLTSLDYWFSRNNSAVFAALESGLVPAHTYQLSDDERWSVVDYARTFSYLYLDPLAPPPPIEVATITGHVVNGTTADFVTEGMATLRAFDENIQEMLTLTTTVGVEGRFDFNLTQVPADWIYMVDYSYKGLSFNSRPNQLSRANPMLEMPVTVYETTTDPAVVAIEQIHVILDFQGDLLNVAELYVVSNVGTAVFTGPSGDPAQGTVEIVLPAGAQDVEFQRAFGSLDSFFPALDILQTETGWADVQPLSPGSGGLNLLVRYNLPFSEGLTLAHPVQYTTGSTSVIVPDNGVTLSGGNWVGQGIQAMEQGSFASYAGSGLVAGDVLSLTLEGTPRLVTDSSGNAILVRDDTTELFVGASALLVILGVAVYTVRGWQMETADNQSLTADDLLEEIADLDDEFENGRISEKQYTRQRNRLKAEVTALWQDNA